MIRKCDEFFATFGFWKGENVLISKKTEIKTVIPPSACQN